MLWCERGAPSTERSCPPPAAREHQRPAGSSQMNVILVSSTTRQLSSLAPLAWHAANVTARGAAWPAIGHAAPPAQCIASPSAAARTPCSSLAAGPGVSGSRGVSTSAGALFAGGSGRAPGSIYDPLHAPLNYGIRIVPEKVHTEGRKGCRRAVWWLDGQWGEAGGRAAERSMWPWAMAGACMHECPPPALSNPRPLHADATAASFGRLLLL